MLHDNQTIAFLAGGIFLLVGFLVGLGQVVEVALGKFSAQFKGTETKPPSKGQRLLIVIPFVIAACLMYPFVANLYKNTKQNEPIHVDADGAVRIPFGTALVGGGREHSLELQAAGKFPGGALMVHRNPDGSYKSSELLVETKNGELPSK